MKRPLPRALEKGAPEPGKSKGMLFVYETVKREILELKLRPGVALDENSLAKRFEMSRSPIREALIRLSGDGLVEMLSNRATLVTRFDLSEFPKYIEARDFIERINTRLAAIHRVESDLEKMTEKAVAFEAACKTDDRFRMSLTNKEFHMAVAAAGQNRHLSDAYSKILDEGRRLLHMHFTHFRSSHSEKLNGQAHADIIGAIRNQDVEEADRLAHEHTKLFRRRIMEAIEAQYFDSFDFSKSANK